MSADIEALFLHAIEAAQKGGGVSSLCVPPPYPVKENQEIVWVKREKPLEGDFQAL